jgi:hypothetical protein
MFLRSAVYALAIIWSIHTYALSSSLEIEITPYSVASILLVLPRGVARLSFTARIERPPFHRGGSASKKDGLAAPPFLLSPRVPGAQDQRGCSIPILCLHLEGAAWLILDCARRKTIVHLNDPSKLACFFSPGRGHPCWSKCGRRTRPFSGRAFREHRTNMGVP